jgi:hypothetical protein
MAIEHLGGNAYLAGVISPEPNPALSPVSLKGIKSSLLHNPEQNTWKCNRYHHKREFAVVLQWKSGTWFWVKMRYLLCRLKCITGKIIPKVKLTVFWTGRIM